MKKLVCMMLLCLFVAGAYCQTYLTIGRVKVDGLNVTLNGGNLLVSMDIDVSGMDIPSSREVVFAPVLRFDNHEQSLPAVVLAGRTRYYLHLRNESSPAVGTSLFRAGHDRVIHYNATVPYSDWMENATLELGDELCGCLCEVLYSDRSPLTTLDFAPKVFSPEFVYLAPRSEEVKTRELKGSAYIDFPVNRTEIYEDYRRNPVELAKIRATIDTVRNDPDTRITSIRIKGYASPEGSYANNTRLAKGRTETLKNYVQRLYNFPFGIMSTDYEPEDWAGLERYLETCTLPGRYGILELARSGGDPDAREQKIKTRYPEDYRFLLSEVYPGLRHSDYAVEYVVRAYTDVEEARRIWRTAPGKLSLNEFYCVAESYPAGSDEYNEVFETMVRLYPDDATANLNACNVAMARGDLVSARKYAAKSGDTAEAVYARGVLSGFEKDYAQARMLLTRAQGMGVKEAADALEQINKIDKK
ncbi:DUF3868 domain-containing protein [Phocaeicola sp.]|uniref:DUF3868 domain-containing protein n=1 Tax=Phocaeicola sp. TaxID=2773926 RepID=UPI0023CC7F7D|nr:DUF3868 domain-containing protein [Phocaeicola sp.]MDE5677151.1 DUF3868 domain-containing protein [Phocaeicola sp.]